MGKSRGYVVLGIGAFGKSVALALAEAKEEVVIVDKDEALISEIDELVTESVIGDVTKRDLLRELQIQDARAVIVCVGRSLESSILATLACKDLGCKQVVAKATSREHKEILQRIGADQVVLPERMMARQLAQQLVNPSVLDRLVVAPGYSAIRTPVPAAWVGLSLAGLDVRREYAISVIAVERGGNDDGQAKSFLSNPDPENPFEKGDILLVLGSDEALQRFQVLGRQSS